MDNYLSYISFKSTVENKKEYLKEFHQALENMFEKSQSIFKAKQVIYTLGNKQKDSETVPGEL